MELFSIRADWEKEPVPAIISQFQLFSALSMAARHLESQKSTETQRAQNCFIATVRNQNTPTICISVVASEHADEDLRIRFQRALIRGGDKDPKQDTPEEFERFRQLDERESAGIEAARKKATHTVLNQDDQQAATFEQVDKIMAEFGILPLMQK